MLLDEIECFVRAVFHYVRVVDSLKRNAGGRRQRPQLAVTVGLMNEYLVEVAVIVTGKDHHLVATCEGARQPHSGLHRFGTGACETGPIHTRKLANHFCDFAYQWCLGADLKPAVQLFFHRFAHVSWRMAEEMRPEAVQQVDVFVAVHIPELRTQGSLDPDGIHHFFPATIEASGRSWICKPAAIPLRTLLRAGGLSRVVVDQPIQMLLLATRKGLESGFCNRTRPERGRRLSLLQLLWVSPLTRH